MNKPTQHEIDVFRIKEKAQMVIQSTAYDMSKAQAKAFEAGEYKDGKKTEEWREYRRLKSIFCDTIDRELEDFLGNMMKLMQEELLRGFGEKE